MKIKSFLNAGMGAIGTQLIAIATLPFLARLYSPSDFAPWALGIAFVVFLGSISTLRYDLALVVERNPHDASVLFWLNLILSLFIFLLVTVGIFVVHKNGWLFRGTQVSQSTWLVAGWLFLFIQNLIWSTWNQYHGSFLVISIAQLSNAVVMSTIQFYGALIQDGGSYWLVLGSLLGQAVALMILFSQGCKKHKRPGGLRDAYRSFATLAWRHRRYVHYSLPFTFFGAVRDRLPLLLIGVWVSSKEIGLYSQAWRLSNVPAGLTGSAIRPVALRTALSQGLSALESPIHRILFWLTVMGSSTLALLVIEHQNIFTLLLGENWKPIGPYITAMAFPALAFAMSNWMDRLVDMQGKQHINLWTEIICGLGSTLGLVIVLALGYPLLAAVVTQSILLTLNYLFFIYLTYRIAGYKLIPLANLLLVGVTIFCTSYGLLSFVKTLF